MHQAHAALGLLESFRGVGPQPNRREHRFDHVRRPQMRPVGLREAIERQAAIQIIRKASRRPIVTGMPQAYKKDGVYSLHRPDYLVRY